MFHPMVVLRPRLADEVHVVGAHPRTGSGAVPVRAGLPHIPRRRVEML